MSKIYAPSIQSALPAFRIKDDIKINFSLNRATSADEIYGVRVVFKSVSSGNIIYDYNEKNLFGEENKPDFADYIAWSQERDYGVFKIPYSSNSGLQENTFYKVQISFYNKAGQEGYFSQAGIIKCCTSEIELSTVEVAAYSDESILSLVAKYTSEDLSEKINSFKVILYDKNLDVLYSSDEQIYNNSNDIFATKKENDKDIQYIDAQVLFELPELNIDQTTIAHWQFYVTTTNGLELESDFAVFSSNPLVPIKSYLKLDLELNADNAYIAIKINQPEGTPISGYFLISRAKNTTNYSAWDPLYKFCFKENDSSFIYQDNSIEAGVSYKYAIQQFNMQNIFSERQISDPILANFEDMFLSDGERQLRICFNPKVSSFKNTVLETKTDTIGNRTPFFFRNGNVNYKEIPISGLISYLMDTQHLFASFGAEDAEILYNENAENCLNNDYNSLIKKEWQNTTNLTADNAFVELQFKLKVLEWLSNGKPKLFRSPYEGSYIVRLMNVSLTPQDTLGRMLHTFNATAYEISDYSYKNLLSNDLILNSNIAEDYNAAKVTKIKTYTKADAYLVADVWTTYFFKDNPMVEKIVIRQAPINTIIEINENKFIVGVTGQLVINIETNIQTIYFDKTYVKDTADQEIIFDMYYIDEFVDSENFNFITEVNYNKITLATVIGDNTDFMEQFKDKEITVKFYYLAFEPKAVIETEVTEDVLKNTSAVFALKDSNSIMYSYLDNEGKSQTAEELKYYIEYKDAGDNDFKLFYVQDDHFEYADKNGFKFDSLKIGSGLIAHISYSILEKKYASEEEVGITATAEQEV